MAKPERKSFSLAGRIIARVIVCQLVLTAALTTVAVLYARQELGHGFDAALNGWAINTLAAVRYTETEVPDLLFDPSLLLRHPIRRTLTFSRFAEATATFWRDPRHQSPQNGRKGARSAISR